MWARADVVEGLHVAFEVEEEFEGWDREGEGWFCPLCLCEVGDAWGWLDGALFCLRHCVEMYKEKLLVWEL